MDINETRNRSEMGKTREGKRSKEKYDNITTPQEQAEKKKKKRKVKQRYSTRTNRVGMISQCTIQNSAKEANLTEISTLENMQQS